MLMTNFATIPFQSGGPWLDGWSGGKKITIPKADTPLQNFPLPVYLNESNFDFSQCKPDGSDIRFSDSNLNLLKFERKRHQNGNKDLYNLGVKQIPFELLTTSDGTSNIINSAVEQASSVRILTTKADTNLGNKGSVYRSKEKIDLTNISTLSIEFSEMILRNANTSNSAVVGVVAAEAPYTNAQLNGAGSAYLAFATTVNDGAKTMVVDVSAVNQSAYIVVVGMTSAFTANGLDMTMTKIYFNTDYPAGAEYNVLLPTVSDLTDTEVYMWYGNPSAYNTSIEAWQDQTGKQLTYNGNVKLVPIPDTMRIATSTTGVDYLDYYKNGVVNSAKTFVVEAKIKVETSGSITGHGFGVGNGTKTTGVDVKAGSVIINRFGTMYTHALDTTSDFNTIRIEFEGTTQVRYYLNDALIRTVPYSELYSGATNYVWWGDGYGTANYGGSALWKYVKYNADLTGTPTAFVEWNPTMGLPTANGWAVEGTASLASLITENYTCRSAYFDGSGDYFSLADSDDWYLNNGNPYCYEMTIFAQGLDTTNYNGLFNQTEVAASSRMTCHMRLNKFIFTVYYSGSYKVNLAVDYTFENNRIYRIKIACENSTTWRLIIDDVLAGSQTNATAVSYNFPAPFQIGIATDPTVYWNSNILGMRITKGRPRVGENQPSQYNVDGSDVVFCTNFDTIYDQNYAMIQHMGDTLVDATGNGNNGTATGTTVVDTALGRARRFDVSSHITIQEVTISGNWNSMVLITHGSSYAQYESIITGLAGTNIASYTPYLGYGQIVSHPSGVTSTTVLSSGTYAIEIDHNGTAERVFLNGIKEMDINTTYATLRASIIGKHLSNSTEHFIGDMHEIRLGKTRSDAWIKAESLGLKNELVIIEDI